MSWSSAVAAPAGVAPSADAHQRSALAAGEEPFRTKGSLDTSHHAFLRAERAQSRGALRVECEHGGSEIIAQHPSEIA
jgi:hypothetical protein